MQMRINQLFPGTRRLYKSEIDARIDEIAQRLNLLPLWMLGQKRVAVVGCALRKAESPPPELARTPRHNYLAERDLSSTVRLEPAFVLPLPSTGIDLFQVFSKTKKRKRIQQVWEFLMLDLWSQVLRHYSQSSSLTLHAPQSYKLEGDWLLMAFHQGTIGDHLSQDYRASLRVQAGRKEVSLYAAFALYLGALAHVKEAEELSHGDYQLRHVLFDPGDQLQHFYYLVRAFYKSLLPHVRLPEEAFLSPSSLTVVDIEHGLRTPAPKVQEEDEKMFLAARAFCQSHGVAPSDFERAYRDGFDEITPQGIVQSCVDQQHHRWGFSVDNLF